MGAAALAAADGAGGTPATGADSAWLQDLWLEWGMHARPPDGSSEVAGLGSAGSRGGMAAPASRAFTARRRRGMRAGLAGGGARPSGRIGPHGRGGRLAVW